MPTLVLLPGMDGSGDLFAPFVESLGPDVTTVVVRYPDEPLGYQQLVAYVRGHLPDNGDYFLLGESFSGPVAVALAAECDARLKGLILSAAFICNPMSWTRPLAFLTGLLPVQGAPAALMTRLLLGRFSTPSVRAMIASSLAQASAPTLRARLRAIATVDMTDRLAGVDAPILYLRAAHDRVVFRSACRLIARHKPDMRCVTLEAPHFLLQVAYQEAASVVRAFMSGAVTATD